MTPKVNLDVLETIAKEEIGLRGLSPQHAFRYPVELIDSANYCRQCGCRAIPDINHKIREVLRRENPNPIRS